jgi:hypothetical protein
VGPENVFHEIVWLWRDPKQAYRAKSTFLTSAAVPDEAIVALHPDWQYICLELFIGFRETMQAALSAKEGRLFKPHAPLEDGTVPNRFGKILEDVHGTYGRILSLFDDALVKALERASQSGTTSTEPLEPEVTNPPATVSDTTAPQTVETVNLPRTSKRRAQDCAEDGTPTKPRPKRMCPSSRVPKSSAPSDSEAMSDSNDDEEGYEDD